MSKAEDQFGARIFDCVHIALKRRGSATAEVIMFRNFQKKTGFYPTEITKNPQEFINCIHEIFVSGSKTIENEIVAEICKEFALPHPSALFSNLPDAIRAASGTSAKEISVRG